MTGAEKMTTGSIAVGVDVSKHVLDVFVLEQRRFRRFVNDAGGAARLAAWLKRLSHTPNIVLEATGTMGWRAIAALAGAGLAPRVVNPARVKAFRAAEGKHAKTDRLDAELIARFASVMSEKARPAPSAEQLKIKSLSARRRQLAEMLADEKKRLQQAFDEFALASIRATIALLKAEKTRVETALLAAIEADAEAGARYRILISIHGVGPAIAALLIAELPELGALNRHEVASLAGVAPQANQSGLREGRARVRGGRPHVRTALYLAAFNARRVEGPFKDFYQRQRAAGKPYNVALIAVARKSAVHPTSRVKELNPGSAFLPPFKKRRGSRRPRQHLPGGRRRSM
jgi:transposase